MKYSLQRKPGLLSSFPTISILLISLAIIFFSYVMFGSLGFVVGALVSHLPLDYMQHMHADDMSPAYLAGLKVMLIFSDLGQFLLPALLLPWLIFGENPIHFFGLNKRSHFLLFLLAVLLILSMQPMVDLTARINQHMKFPASLSGLEKSIQDMEKSAEKIMGHFLYTNNLGGFIINALIVAVLPAIVEEFFFRGFLQTSLMRWLKNGHWAVFIAAFVFSFIHFEFYGFLPRLLLGMLMGYVYLWSGDIKMSMLIHFTNNFMGLAMTYYLQLHGKTPELGAPKDSPTYATYIVSAIFMIALLYIFKSRAASQQLPVYESDQDEA